VASRLEDEKRGTLWMRQISERVCGARGSSTRTARSVLPTPHGLLAGRPCLEARWGDRPDERDHIGVVSPAELGALPAEDLAELGGGDLEPGVVRVSRGWRRPCRGPSGSEAPRPTRWRWRPRWPSRGPTSSSAAWRPSTPCAATSPPSTSPGTPSSTNACRRSPSRPTSTGSGAPSSPWN
jgi:hypothetical protein